MKGSAPLLGGGARRGRVLRANVEKKRAGSREVDCTQRSAAAVLTRPPTGQVSRLTTEATSSATGGPACCTVCSCSGRREGCSQRSL